MLGLKSIYVSHIALRSITGSVFYVYTNGTFSDLVKFGEYNSVGSTRNPETNTIDLLESLKRNGFKIEQIAL
jgi:hypothetical protein